MNLNEKMVDYLTGFTGLPHKENDYLPVVVPFFKGVRDKISGFFLLGKAFFGAVCRMNNAPTARQTRTYRKIINKNRDFTVKK